MKSVSLSYDEVKGIIEKHLNDHELRSPHKVVDIDAWNYGAKNEDIQFNIGLEPAPTALPLAEDTRPLMEAIAELGPLPASNGTNGTNGHAHKNGGGKTAVKKEGTAEPSSDGRKRGRTVSFEERERIVGLVNAGVKRKEIAEAVGLTESQLFATIAELRAGGQLPDRAKSAVA
jgi:hypothetical protein